MKNVAAVVIMLAVIVGFGRLTNAVFVDRAWVPISEPPTIPGFLVIKKLPPPFKLNYPGAARVWIYQHRGDETVYLVTVFYQAEKQGSELVSSENGFLDREQWRHGSTTVESVELPGGPTKLEKMVYHAQGEQQIAVLSQYRFVHFTVTVTPLLAKLYALLDAVRGANGSAQVSLIYSNEYFGDGMNNNKLAATLPEEFLFSLDSQLHQQ